MSNFTILKTKVLNGVMYTYVKDSTGLYGWYRLDAVEAPESDTDSQQRKQALESFRRYDASN